MHGMLGSQLVVNFTSLIPPLISAVPCVSLRNGDKSVGVDSVPAIECVAIFADSMLI